GADAGSPRDLRPRRVRDHARPGLGLREPGTYPDGRLACIGAWLEDLRPAEPPSRCGGRPGLRVERTTWAFREARVAVAGNRVQQHRNPARVALATSGDVGEEGGRIDVRQVEPPGDEALDRVEGRGGRLRAPVRAEKGDSD